MSVKISSCRKTDYAKAFRDLGVRSRGHVDIYCLERGSIDIEMLIQLHLMNMVNVKSLVGTDAFGYP